MNAILLAASIIAAVVVVFVLLCVRTKRFAGWKLSEKVGLVQVFLPFAAAILVLNAFAGASLERPSKIVAAVFTLAAGLLAILKQVAASLEAHQPREGEAEAQPQAVSLGEALSALVRR